MKTIKTLVLGVVLSCSSIATASAQVDMFLKFQNNKRQSIIKGESTQRGFEDAIEIDAFSWGASNSGGGSRGGGASAGKVSIQNFNFTKYFDAASPALFIYCCKGTPIPRVVLTVRKRPLPSFANAAPPERSEGNFMEIVFSDVVVTKINEDGNNSDSQGYLAENIAISFGSVEITYIPIDSGGKPITEGWNLKTNK